MATLEKPKSKVRNLWKVCNSYKEIFIFQKQKKKQIKEEKIYEDNDESFDTYKTSGAACSKLVSHDCAVSKKFQAPLKEEDDEDDDISSAPTFDDFDVDNDHKEQLDESTSKSIKEELLEGEIEEVNNDFEEDEMVVEPWTSRFEPTAPISDLTVSTFIQPEPEHIVQYPSLSTLRLAEESTHPAGTNSRFVTKPKAFTVEQMKEIYCCKELDNVRQFETYFIQHNLHFSYESEPLFLLLQAYSLLRGKLKMNLMDLKKLQLKFKKYSEKIWCSRHITEKFEAMCADNVLMQISETFEWVFYV